MLDLAVTDDGSFWASASTFGTADTTGNTNFYVENNYFQNFAVAINRSTSSRTVFRFNEMHDSTVADHGFDTSTLGERHSEIYNNNFYCDSGQSFYISSWISTRGGTHRIFKTEQAENLPTWEGTYPNTYPIAHQIGWGHITGRTTRVGADTISGSAG